ncbi:hypothetical protein AAZX31_11G221100 [Glycine max]
MTIKDISQLSSLLSYRASEALGENGENKSTISKHIKIICDEGRPPKDPNAPQNSTSVKVSSGSSGTMFRKNNNMKSNLRVPPKRGCGRPPKPKVPLPPSTILFSPRPRDHPPKDPNTPQKSISVKVLSGSSEIMFKKNNYLKSNTNASLKKVHPSLKRPWGRPPKARPKLEVVDEN